MPVIPALKEPKQKDHRELKAGLNYTFGILSLAAKASFGLSYKNPELKPESNLVHQVYNCTFFRHCIRFSYTVPY